MAPIPLLVALADPTRCRIVEILHQGPQPVHVLAASFAISRPAISRHLRVLKEAKLISEKKSGRENRYALHAKALRPLAKWLEQFAGGIEIASPATVAPAVAAEPEPVLAKQVEAIPSTRPRRDLSASQMGFDF